MDCGMTTPAMQVCLSLSPSPSSAICRQKILWPKSVADFRTWSCDLGFSCGF
jgi:hypothetical protein